MRTGFNVVVTLGIIFVLFTTVGVFIADWERPPMETRQIGYRGVGMEQISNPRTQGDIRLENRLPTVIDPVPPGGRPAREAYQNVQILGDLTEDQFNRLMLAITEWVSPEQGCAYCHNVENLAEDVPNKVIARRMFQMTKHINQNWTQHVAQTGVTCYTCHRGRPVPAEVWFRQSTGQPKGLVGYDGGQNHPAPSAGLSSLPMDPFTEQLDSPADSRVVGKTALPVRQGPSIKKAEYTYALMIQMSQSLGVNCTYCHNSRAFLSWDQSVPPRNPAWHGIRMVRDLNQNFISPLKPMYTKAKLGPLGDVAKVNCTTCHRGQIKPLGGAQLLKDNPELNAAILEPVASMPVPAARPEQEPQSPTQPVGRQPPAAPGGDQTRPVPPAGQPPAGQVR